MIFLSIPSNSRKCFASDHQSVLDYDQIIFLTKNQKKYAAVVLLVLEFQNTLTSKPAMPPFYERVEWRCACLNLLNAGASILVQFHFY